MLGFFHLNQWRHRRAEDPERALKLAREHTHKALELDPASSRAHFVLGTLYLFDKRDHALALAEFERASRLNPNSADRMAWMSLLKSFMGKPDEAVEWIEKAKRHNPHHAAWYDWNASLAYYLRVTTKGLSSRANRPSRSTRSRFPHIAFSPRPMWRWGEWKTRKQPRQR